MTSSATSQRENLGQQTAGAGSVPRGLVDRDELLQSLDRAVSSKRVTVISAPPGSGKTSLLRAWADRSPSAGRVAFVSVEREQEDAQRFWSAVLDAIRSQAPSVDQQAQPDATAGLDGDQVVERVVSEVAEQAEPLVLIIDDLHELRSGEAIDQLERLLANLPSSAHIVLSSRRDLPIRLHDLRLADQIAEIRADDLRFTERETRELLSAAEIGLSDAGVAALHQRTEGWAAGLRLAVISLSAHPDPESFVEDFSGTDRAIGEYLMAEMLERQPGEVQRMLLRTSLVERVNGELADLLADRAGSERMLLELEDANAFVVSLDPRRTWFRYHHLLADFLRLELRRSFADEVPDLHRRAARWFDDHGYVIEAVRHTVAAGDWADAARLLADHLFSLTLDGQEGAIAALLRSFPAGVSADHPELALARAAVQLEQGRLDEAAAQLALAESHVQGVPPARRPRLTVATASLRLALARRSGQFAEVTEQLNMLDASIAGESSEPVAISSELRGVALMNLGIVETWSRRFDDAEGHLSEGAALAQEIGRHYLEVGCRAHLVFPTTRVSLASARERGREAVALAERYGLGDRPILAPAHGALAFWAIWTGEFDEGESALRRAWEVAEPQFDPAAAVLLHLVTGQLQTARGQHRAALEAFAAGARAQSQLAGVHAFATPVVGWLAATQARLGMPEEARETLSETSAELDGMGFIDNASAVISLAEGDPTGALDVLRETPDVASTSGFAFTLVEARLLAGLAHLQLGDRNAAAAATEEALAAAERDRLLFPFAMTDAAELLETLPRHETAHRALLADIVDLLRGEPAPGTDRESLSEPDELSPSELRVLRYLPTNLTRPEIARELYVSINTVNTHMRNIYSKLGAHDRSSAVQRARELRILSAGGSRTG
ncbi:MAG TPA: AAA family ATPase [Solirubrobacterales bacterium]|nr:AAA family ATPase [Solirubrobacterales bacterium]